MLRVLHCLMKLDRAGTETNLMNLYRNIDREKMQFDFLVFQQGEYEEEILQMGGRIFHLPFLGKVGPYRYAKNLRFFFKSHPEYVILHAHMDQFNGMILREAKAANILVRISHSHSVGSEGDFLKRMVKSYYSQFIKKNATHLIACSKEAALWLYKKDAERSIILKNGVDLNKFQFIDKRNTRYFTIGNVGRFCKVKNQLFLVDVFAEIHKNMPESRLIIVGEGGLRDKIEKKVKILGLTQAVTLTGTQQDVAGFMQKFDVFCMPSLYEGFGISLIEAQACGVPCVASTTVSRETELSENIEYCSLSMGKDEWAKAVLRQKNALRKNNTSFIQKNGYDIFENAQKLQDYYFEWSTAQNEHSFSVG